MPFTNETDTSFKQKLVSGILWRGLNVLFAFAFNALLVYKMGAGTSGGFFYLLNNLFFAVLLLSVGLESGISFYNARKEIPVPQLFTISIVWSLLATLIFFCALQLLPSLSSLHFKHAYAGLCAYVFGSMLTSFLSSIFFTAHNSKIPNLVATITNGLLILLLPAMPWMKPSMDFETYFIVYFLSPLFSATLLVLVLLKQKAALSFKAFTGKLLKPLFIFSFHSFLISLLFSLLKRCDFWLVNKWCNAADAGNYFQASKVIQLLLLLPALATFSLYPLIVQSIKNNEQNQQQPDTENKVMQLVGLYMLVALFLSIGIIAFGYWVFLFLYGPSFNKLYLVTLYLIPGLLFFAGSFPLTTYFAGKNQNKIAIIFLSISIIFLVISNVILTPVFFIYGAAISSSIANFIYFALMLRRFLLQNKLPFSYKPFIDFVTNARFPKNFIQS